MSSFNKPVLLTLCQHLAVFTATGADASSFLQSQLTQDVNAVSAQQAALAGFCTAQGRLWASMLLAQQPGQDQAPVFVGVVSADLIESFLKRLRMFVLRSKVMISPETDRKAYGVQISADDIKLLSNYLQGELPTAPWTSVTLQSGLWIRVPSGSADLGRWLWLPEQSEFDALVALLGNQAQLEQSPDRWQVQDIKAGLAWVQAATQDLFIAQTLNLDLIGGVSFTKGCYPGQEVIARAHYRGTVKRRMHLAIVKGPHPELSAGMDIFEAHEAENPVGRLINVARDLSIECNSPDAGDTWVLLEAPFKALEAAALRVGSCTGPELIVQPLPYALDSR